MEFFVSNIVDAEAVSVLIIGIFYALFAWACCCPPPHLYIPSPVASPKPLG
jgi:hypothetical protein